MPADKLRREFPHGRAQDRVQIAAPQQKIAAVAVQPDIAQRHVHILLDAEQLLAQLAVFRTLLLQEQAHGGDGCLDLVCPERVIRAQIGHFPIHPRDGLRPVLRHRAAERLIIVFQRVRAAVRQILRSKARIPADLRKQPVLPPEVQKIAHADRQHTDRAQQRCVPDVLRRHPAEIRHRGIRRAVECQQHDHPHAGAKIHRKLLHRTEYPNPFFVAI